MAQLLWTCATAVRKTLDPYANGLQLWLFTYLIRNGAASPVEGVEQRPLLEPEQRGLPSVTDTSSEEFALSDGRKLGVAYFGAENGSPVFYLHGYPGCRLSGGAFFDRAGKKLGARIIAIDRPGIGNSSPQPGHKPLDLVNDIRELAEHLNLKSYGVIGVSGGGPYALACAYALPPEELRSVSIIGGMGPIDVGFKGMSWSNWLTFMALMYFPFIARWLQNKVVHMLRKMPNEKIIAEVQTRITERSARLLDPDLMYLMDPESLATMLDLYREHYKQGVDGYMEDGRVLTTDWGFSLEDIPAEIPIQLWYSKKDTNVPFRMGEAIASRLSSRPEFHVDENETHLKLVLKSSASALESLLEKM